MNGPYKLLTSLVLLSSLLLVGCGGGSARLPIAGSVTFDDAPIEEGSITFLPLDTEKQFTAGATITAGNYAVPAAQGLAPGKYRVEIKASRKTGKKIVDDMRRPPDNMVDEIEQFVPAKFNTASTLVAEITAENNRSQNFELTKD